jgi:hypothetical protein
MFPISYEVWKSFWPIETEMDYQPAVKLAQELVDKSGDAVQVRGLYRSGDLVT